MAITNAQQFRQMFRYGGGPEGPAGGASAGGNYGGDSSGGKSASEMGGGYQGPGRDDRVDPGFQNALRDIETRQNEITKSQDPNFGQFFGSRVPVYQPATFGQNIDQTGS